MSIMIVGGILFGTILGRFFRIYILVPASALAVVLLLASPSPADSSMWYTMLEIGVLVTSLQFGYVVGLVTGSASLVESTSRAWEHNATTRVSRSYHIQ
jgi:hypothetical protein